MAIQVAHSAVPKMKKAVMTRSSAGVRSTAIAEWAVLARRLTRCSSIVAVSVHPALRVERVGGRSLAQDSGRGGVIRHRFLGHIRHQSVRWSAAGDQMVNRCCKPVTPP